MHWVDKIYKRPERRRIRDDLIQLFQTMKRFDNADKEHFLNWTRFADMIYEDRE